MTEDFCQCDIRETRSRRAKNYCEDCGKKLRPPSSKEASGHSAVFYENLGTNFDRLRETDITDFAGISPDNRTNLDTGDTAEDHHYQKV